MFIVQKIKIYGAGSVGNHLAHAARSLGASVVLCDTDPKALERTRELIYPQRYGHWDEEISLHLADEAPTGGFDMVCIGTPPDTHIPLALQSLDENPGSILIEKPLCAPDLDGAQALVEKAADLKVPAFVGYDHAVGAATGIFEEWIEQKRVGEAVSLEVLFMEHWDGIFAAHPWLDGPQDTYLGFWRRGGGASGEHSHALNLWQHFARLFGAGEVIEVQASMDYVKDAGVEYDCSAKLTLRTENGLSGQVTQDVVSTPPRKTARLVGKEGFMEWHCGYEPGCDAVLWGNGENPPEEHKIGKTRPDDFIRELTHIRDAVSGGKEQWQKSPIALAYGVDTMVLISAAHRSAMEDRAMRIDRSAGYGPQAIIPL